MFDIKALNIGNNTGEVLVYGDIVDTGWERWSEEDITPKMFNDALQSLGNVQKINIRLNCYGGSVFAGRAMGAMLQEKKKTGATITTTVEGVAASMASVLLQYGDIRVMWSGTHVMIHKPLSNSRGNADVHRKNADLLDKIEDALIKAYMQHFTGTEDELRAMLAKETWLEAEEAYAVGLCSEVEGIAEVSAHALGYRFGDLIVPRAYLGDYANNIKIPTNKGGENEMIFNKELDAKIKALADEGKSISIEKDGDNYAVSEMLTAKTETAVAILTAEQVQGVSMLEDASGDTVLSALKDLVDAGIDVKAVAAGLAEYKKPDPTLTAKAEKFDALFASEVTEAIKNGVRAKGDSFKAERWTKILNDFSIDEVRAQSEEWANEADTVLHGGEGRLSRVPSAGIPARSGNPEDYKF